MCLRSAMPVPISRLHNHNNSTSLILLNASFFCGKTITHRYSSLHTGIRHCSFSSLQTLRSHSLTPLEPPVFASTRSRVPASLLEHPALPHGLSVRCPRRCGEREEHRPHFFFRSRFFSSFISLQYSPLKACTQFIARRPFSERARKQLTRHFFRGGRSYIWQDETSLQFVPFCSSVIKRRGG
jgi:hypothetical protein